MLSEPALEQRLDARSERNCPYRARAIVRLTLAAVQAVILNIDSPADKAGQFADAQARIEQSPDHSFLAGGFDTRRPISPPRPMSVAGA
jgi:hypothetical protein